MGEYQKLYQEVYAEALKMLKAALNKKDTPKKQQDNKSEYGSLDLDTLNLKLSEAEHRYKKQIDKVLWVLIKQGLEETVIHELQRETYGSLKHYDQLLAELLARHNVDYKVGAIYKR